MILLSQWLLYAFSFAWRVFHKVSHVGIEHLADAKRPFILAANHGSKFDPFLLSFLPYKVVKKLIPLRFPTASLYFDQILYRLLISPLGAYRMQRWSTSLEAYMKESIDIVTSGGVVLIFPEGQIVKKEGESIAKPGVALLGKATAVPIIPLRLEKIRGDSFFGFYAVKLSFGEPIILQGNDFSKEALTNDSQMILNIIYSL